MPEPHFLVRLYLERLNELVCPRNEMGWNLSIPGSRGNPGLGSQELENLTQRMSPVESLIF